jgi:hypothetical protein
MKKTGFKVLLSEFSVAYHYLKQECLQDAYGSPLTFSGLSHDTMFNALMRFVYEAGLYKL